MEETEKGKNIYFLSDAHLGASVLNNNREREQKLVGWLESIRPHCSVLFLLGDIFDFWFEYKRVVPKGFVRFLAKLCEFRCIHLKQRCRKGLWKTFLIKR